MDAAYKQILASRHGMLSNIKWSSKLGRLLGSERVFHRHVMTDIQIESNDDNKVYIMLAKLPQQSGNDVFANFCDVIELCGYGDVAATLKHDKDQINLDGRRNGTAVQNMDEFIDLLKDIQLTELLTEKDETLRTRRKKQFKERLTCLGRYIIKQQQRNNELRAHVFSMIQQVYLSSKASSSGSHGSDSDSDSSMLDLSDAGGFAKLAQTEENKDREVISELRRALACQEENEKYLNEQIQNHLDKINEYEQQKQQASKRQTLDKDSQRVSILEDMITKKDKELAKLHNKKWDEHEQLKKKKVPTATLR